MAVRPKLHVVDADTPQSEEIRRAFAAEGFEVSTSATLREAGQALQRFTPDVLIVSDDLPDGRGIDLINEPKLKEAGCVGIALVRDPSISDVVDAMRRGAIDVIEKPVFAGHLSAIVGKALADRRQVKRPRPTSNTRDQLKRPPIVGQSEPLQRLLSAVELVTKAPRSTVLIQGESGTGKELIARAIHFDGPRRARPFLAINCATLTENLLEAELFGYEKGAFTGALANGKKGLFEAADGGTLFLDEVGELAPSLQARLLRVLQENTFKRVGGVEDIRVDVRVIAATNRDLRKEVDEGGFRADLFYRLAVVPIQVPTLRERKSDIPLLVEHFLSRFSTELGREIRGFSSEAQQRLASYSWPGNIRELRNVCEYAAIVCDSDVIEARHLTLPDDTSSEEKKFDNLQLQDMSIKSMESELIRMVLGETRFNITRAAGILGINRSTLYNKMKDYGLQRDQRGGMRRTV